MKNKALLFFIIGTAHPYVSLRAAQKTPPIDFLEKIQTSKTPLEDYLKKNLHKQFLKTADFSQGEHIDEPHHSTAHFQGKIRAGTLFQCCYIVGGCAYTQVACAYLADHAQNCSPLSITHCNEEEFLASLPLKKTKKKEHHNCLLLGFQALKKGISDYEERTAPKIEISRQANAEEYDEEQGTLEYLQEVGLALFEELKILAGNG